MRSEIVYKDKNAEPAGVLQALDISIVDSNGQSIEPAAPVRVDLVMKNLAEKLEKDSDLFTVMHLNESSGSIQVETVADTVKIGNIHPEGASASATFTLDSFSQFAITYGDYVKVNVHYVDVNGTELTGSTSEVTAYNDTTVTMSDYQNRMNQAGYTYLGAHYGTYSGQVFTSLKATRNPTTGSFLCHYFLKPPTIKDEDRTKRGDYFAKPTGYWFWNCEPTKCETLHRTVTERMRINDVKREYHTGECSLGRSMISPDYARNFICDFILGREQPGIDKQLRLSL